MNFREYLRRRRAEYLAHISEEDAPRPSYHIATHKSSTGTSYTTVPTDMDIDRARHLDDRPAWNADAWETAMLRLLTGRRRPWVNRCSTWKYLSGKVTA